MAESPLVLVSNRGPVTFGPGGEARRGTGGLVTALIGLASYRDVTWVASAMTEEDVIETERNDGRAFAVRGYLVDKFKVGDDQRLKIIGTGKSEAAGIRIRIYSSAPEKRKVGP